MKFNFVILFLLFSASNSNIQAGHILHEETREIECLMDGNYKHTSRLIHDPQKIESFSQPFQHVNPVENQLEFAQNFSECTKAGYDMFGMSEQRISQSENKILYTSGLVDCIGLSVWDPLNEVASLKHVTKMELGANSSIFKDHFIVPLMSKITDPSKTTVNIVSSYWTKDTLEMIEIMQSYGFPISGISIPKAAMETTKTEFNRYVDKSTTPPIYFSEVTPMAVMCIDTQTGKVGFIYN
ncbi:MAG: hypothetical protein K2P93_04295 [Alphaproteobacteria bacterium]|nr:hypothetical protein [Alphaproteobacteria bacterium]